jgi:DNA replication protein DnaC
VGSGRSLGELLAAIERRPSGRDGAASSTQREPERCALPPGHSCSGGWHVRPDSGAGTAYGRCPRWRAERAEAAARELPGVQTFDSFERFREPAAFNAVRSWVDSCRNPSDPAGKLALLRHTGCGKTHLLRAATRELTRSGRWVELATALELTAVVRGRALYDSFERSEAEIQAKRWSRADVLIVDGLGLEETAGPATAGFLVGLLEQREGRSLGFSSNLGEAGLESRYGAPLASRLLAGTAVPALRGMDYRKSPVR